MEENVWKKTENHKIFTTLSDILKWRNCSIKPFISPARKTLLNRMKQHIFIGVGYTGCAIVQREPESLELWQKTKIRPFEF